MAERVQVWRKLTRARAYAHTRRRMQWGGSTGRTVTFGILKEKKHAQAAAEAILKMRANLPKDTPKETFKCAPASLARARAERKTNRGDR